MKIQKNILLLRSSIGVYGAERVILELAKCFTDDGVNIIIGVVQNKHNSSTELASAAEALSLKNEVFHCRQPFDPMTALAIRRFIKKNSISIVNSHGYKANFYAFMATLNNNVSCIPTCHPWPGTNDSLKAKFYTSLDMRLLKRFPKIVAISEEVKKEILDAGISENKITVIENGIDLLKFSNHYDTEKLRKDLGIRSGVTIIGTVGRLSPEKGQLDFLNAAKLLKQSHKEVFFLIVGDGPLRVSLQTAIEEMQLHNNVLITGIRNDIPEILSLLDIFVLPSHSEGLPMALLEAMAAKKPIIATSVGAIPNLLSQKESGILIPPGNVNLLKNAMAVLIKNSSKANIIAQNAHSIVVERYSSKRMTEQYQAVYQQQV